jgi:putative transposase
MEPENLVFLDKNVILLGLSRTHSRSQPGTRVSKKKTFYRGAKVTAIGTINIREFQKINDPKQRCKRRLLNRRE